MELNRRLLLFLYSQLTDELILVVVGLHGMLPFLLQREARITLLFRRITIKKFKRILIPIGCYKYIIIILFTARLKAPCKLYHDTVIEVSVS